jgi:hypothetical protein
MATWLRATVVGHGKVLQNGLRGMGTTWNGRMGMGWNGYINYILIKWVA